MAQTKSKAVIYVRVSTEEQATEGFSIQAQLDALRSYAQIQDMEIINEYLDEGVSAKNISGRPQLKRLIKDARNSQFDIVLIYKIDRIARKASDSLKIRDDLEEAGVRLISLKENFDTASPVGKMMYQMMSAFAEMERTTIIERVNMGMTERAKQGKFNGGQCLGYDVKEKSLIVNEEEARIVKQIFSLSEQQLGYKAIVNRLNQSGYKTKNNNQFCVYGVKVILDNPMYIGKIRYGQLRNWSSKRRQGKTDDFILTDGVHEPIITLEQWDKVQHLRKQRSYKPVRSATPYILSGLVRCPACGFGMVPARSKGSSGVSYRYYKCGQFHNKGAIACSSHGIRADTLENSVLAQLSQLVYNSTMLKKILDATNEKRAHAEIPIKDETEITNKKLKQTQIQINNIIDALTKGMNSKAVQSKLEQLEKTLLTLKQQLSDADTAPIDYATLRKLLSDFQSLMNQVGPEQQKILLRLIVKNIQISSKAPRELVTINLHFDFTLEAMQDNFELIKRLYPAFEGHMDKYRNTKIKYNTNGRDLFESLPILPLLMIRFSLYAITAKFLPLQ
ncbi:recombinase family protein [Paenibacillus frigoriresistens]|uniref:recombinase family protein n=1 Tax=Paenibacillus alginolyticus TaxID=59839 RepID=UPI00156463EC|nr:recombinase family protein [Paenibacillus frigoriresistens]NRF93418.1 recombinase family protein [Paenibacillus frigoriresistens]